MKEQFESQNKFELNEDDQLLSEAKWVINSMWEKAMDVNDLPLSVDSSYQAWSEDLERRKSDFARVLFKEARESSGDRKNSAARTLKRLLKLINSDERSKLLKELMTSKEAVYELFRQADEQVASKKTKSERLKSKVKKTIDRLLHPFDDDEDDDDRFDDALMK